MQLLDKGMSGIAIVTALLCHVLHWFQQTLKENERKISRNSNGTCKRCCEETLELLMVFM